MHTGALAALALVLFCLTLVLNTLARPACWWPRPRQEHGVRGPRMSPPFVAPPDEPADARALRGALLVALVPLLSISGS